MLLVGDDVWTVLGTAEFKRIVALSLTVSVSATAVAAVLGLPGGAALAICRFPGRRLLILLANAFLGLPPVVVGLALYLVLSRSGPLGALSLLFTPGRGRADGPCHADHHRLGASCDRGALARIWPRSACRRRDPVTVDPDPSGDLPPLCSNGRVGRVRPHDLRSRRSLDRRRQHRRLHTNYDNSDRAEDERGRVGAGTWAWPRSDRD